MKPGTREFDKYIENKIENIIEEKFPETENREQIEKSVKKKFQKNDGSSSVSRRKFLKALGLGAGGLALSSTAAAGWINLGEAATEGSTQDLKNVLSEGNTAGTNINMNSHNIENTAQLSTNKISGQNNPLKWETSQDAQNHDLKNIGTLSTDQSITDPAGVEHTGELADTSDLHTKTTSQDDLTDFHFDGGRIDVQDTEPSDPSTNDIWIDTS